VRKHGRASVSASVTIEAALAVPVFFFALVCLIYLLELMAIGTAVRSGLQYAGKQAAKEDETGARILYVEDVSN